MIAALYARVSTGKQAERDLSIPDQLSDYCRAKGWGVYKEYVEPGASARDDRRPVFQEMIGEALRKDRPFDVILTLTTSRFFRDATQARVYKHRLAKFGVKVIAAHQEHSDDPMGVVIEGIFELIDQYESDMNSFHTLRAMKENARQGCHNGAKPPFGYRVVEVAGLGNKGMKKRLDINEAEAGIVKMIFELYLIGKDGHRMGIVEIASRLNSIGVTRRGKPWRKNRVHEILRDSVYTGKYFFNKRRTRTGEAKPESERVLTEVPAVLDEETFLRVGKLLESHSPARIPPRVVNSPNLLVGLLKCGKCGSAMTLATGKSGRYRYYKCTRKMGMGAGACDCRNVAMDNFDETVIGILAEHIFTPREGPGHVGDS